jgi:hypothetical protein
MSTAATKEVFVAAGGHPFGARQVALPGGSSAFGLSFGVHAQYDARHVFPVGVGGLGIEEPQIGFRALSVRLESGRIPKALSMRESDGIDSLWGEQCRSRIRWTCVNE